MESAVRIPGAANLRGLPIVALTMGDPAGVGPQLLMQAVREPRVRTSARCLAVGDAAWFAQAARRAGLDLQIRRVQAVRDAAFAEGSLDVLDLHHMPPGGVPIGQVTAVTGGAAVESLRAAAMVALQGLVDAIVTAPLNKQAMHLAGFAHAGQTEFLAELTGTQEYCTMLVTDQLRVFQVTTHVSLREACDLITAERVYRVIGVAHRTLRRLGIVRPRIAVAGLNPHAGENGLLGREEQMQIVPAVARAAAAGIDVSGPWPGDTVFAEARTGGFDGVLAMYHDQGQIPVKLLGVRQGVSVTAGLPIIRTAVDHGSTLALSPQGMAEHGGMMEAILLAARLVTFSELNPDKEG